MATDPQAGTGRPRSSVSGFLSRNLWKNSSPLIPSRSPVLVSTRAHSSSSDSSRKSLFFCSIEGLTAPRARLGLAPRHVVLLCVHHVGTGSKKWGEMRKMGSDENDEKKADSQTKTGSYR